MARPIPELVPPEIKRRIVTKWGTIQDFADTNRLSRKAVYNLFGHGALKRLDNYANLSDRLNITVDEFHSLCQITDQHRRYKAFENLMLAQEIKDVTHLARLAKVSPTTALSFIKGGASPEDLNAYKEIADAIGMTLQDIITARKKHSLVA